MSTIWDVAKLAGVSKSTVSRVMNNQPCSPAAKEAVLSAVKKLNYNPSVFAKNIRTQKSMAIAFMVPDVSNLFYTEIFKGIEDVAYRQEYMVTLCDTQNDPQHEIRYAEKLMQRKIDGLIYSTYKMDISTQQYFINLSKSLPIVFIDYAFKQYEDISIVATEGYNSSREAVKFLYHKGKRNIAYINFPRDVEVTKLRYEGYKSGLEDCGLSFEPKRVYFPEIQNSIVDRSTGYYGVKELISSGIEIDAIMFAADPLAVGALRYFKKEGIKIPDEISLIGFDNNAICEIIDPNLTTIAQPIRDVGTTSAQILLNKINGVENDNDRIFFEGELIQRKTT